jgi:1-acyl-sn-glycerol-3-phosphate acyltransferase
VANVNFIRGLARRAPAPVDALLEFESALLEDMADLRHGRLPGNEIDDWDPEYIRRTLPLQKAIFNRYFRGEVGGLENIPDEGPCLLVGNHSGGLMIADTFVFSMCFYDHFGHGRRFHQLAHDFAARNPALGNLRRYGTLAASHRNAKKAFEAGAPVLVYPGGDYETFRPLTESAEIDFGGRKGFIRLALEAGVPIVPVVSIGGQETALFVTRGQRAAKLMGFDRLTRIKVLPVAIGPPFGITVLDLPARLPLPAKITIEVLPPIDVRERFGDEPDKELVYDEVTGEMQDTLDDLAVERSLPIVG